MDKTIAITLLKQKEDGSLYRLYLNDLDEVAKWVEATNSQAIICYTHGIKFPELKWQKENINTDMENLL